VTLSGTGTTALLCRMKTFRTMRHRVLTTLHVWNLLPNQHHQVPAPMDFGDQHVKEDQPTAMDLFLITDVITLCARNVSGYIVLRCLFPCFLTFPN